MQCAVYSTCAVMWWGGHLFIGCTLVLCCGEEADPTFSSTIHLYFAVEKRQTHLFIECTLVLCCGEEADPTFSSTIHLYFAVEKRQTHLFIDCTLVLCCREEADLPYHRLYTCTVLWRISRCTFSSTVHLYCAVEKRQMSANCRTDTLIFFTALLELFYNKIYN